MKIDVIIPCYNAKDTLSLTLDSIAKQDILSDISVYLVNDCSDYDYQSFVAKYSHFFSISEIDLLENVGPGGARNAGILNSNNPYIVFIDSDDYFYDDSALSTLFKTIHQYNCDLVISSFIYERDGETIVKNYNNIWLHGKIYRRSFLEENKILFNGTRANEDNGFNNLILLLNSRVKYISDITYVYHENKNSITRKDNRKYRITGLEGYTYNINWAILEALKRNCDKKYIPRLAMATLCALYFYYIELQGVEEDVWKIFEWSYKILQDYQLFPEYALKEDEIEELLNSKKEEYHERGITLQYSLSFQEFIEKVQSTKK